MLNDGSGAMSEDPEASAQLRDMLEIPSYKLHAQLACLH